MTAMHTRGRVLAFVLDIGDLMQWWTNDRWVSTKGVGPAPDPAKTREAASAT